MTKRQPLPQFLRERAVGPPRLFKFLAQRYANDLCTKGVVRVGRLHEYRDAELHSGGRLDTGEGTAVLQEVIEHADEKTLSPFAREMIHVGPGTTLTVSGGLRIRRPVDVPDAYVYCMSKSSSWSASSDDEYDACVEIRNVSRFIAAVTRALHTDLASVAYGSVSYVGRTHPWDRMPAPPAFLKDVLYEPQHEYRAVWAPKRLPIKAKIVAHPDIPRCVRLYATR